MKGAVALCVFFFAAFALARPDDNKYTDRYDQTDIVEVFGNEKLFQSGVNCILDKGRCTSEFAELKSHITEALQNACAKCTDTQKAKTKQAIGLLINKHPQIWDELKDKYDPENKYANKYEKELSEVRAG